jgi:hypothetical protein
MNNDNGTTSVKCYGMHYFFNGIPIFQKRYLFALVSYVRDERGFTSPESTEFYRTI